TAQDARRAGRGLDSPAALRYNPLPYCAAGRSYASGTDGVPAPSRRKQEKAGSSSRLFCFVDHRPRTARVAKLVDAPGLGPDASNGVGVRVPSLAPRFPYKSML